MNTKILTFIITLICPFLLQGQTITGPGGGLTPPGTTSGVVNYVATASGIAGSTLTGGTCPTTLEVIPDLNVPAIIGYNTEITNITLFNIEHTFAADLDLRLIAPNGTIFTFNTDNGGSTGLDPASQSGTAPFDMCFDITAIDCADAWTSQSGSPAPPQDCLLFETSENNCGPLDATFAFVCGPNSATFDGVEVNGTWTLEITDDAGGDTGSFDSFSVTFGPITPPMADSAGVPIDLLSCCAPPIPTMGQWGIMCLGLMLMIFSIIAIRQRRSNVILN